MLYPLYFDDYDYNSIYETEQDEKMSDSHDLDNFYEHLYDYDYTQGENL